MDPLDCETKKSSSRYNDGF